MGNYSSSSPQSVDMEKLAIHRPACGRAEPLGALYDIHTDKFVPGNIFCDKSMADFVNTESINSLEYSQSFTDDLKDRREALNISGEVSLSILAGLIKVGGSASYINDSKNTEHSVQYHITQHIRTVTQSLNFYNSDMLKHIALNAVNCGATHVVWKIEKGADACMSVIYKYGKGSSLMDVKGELQGKLDKWKVSLDAKIRGDYVDGENFTTRNLEVKVHADVAPPVLRLPDTLESAMEMLKSIYESIMTNGEGVAQQYFLVDLRALAMLWQVEIAVQKMYTEISVKVIGNLEEMLRKIESQKRRIKEIKEKSNNPAVSEDGIRRIVEKYQMCDAEETEIKKELMTLLPRAREGDNNALVDLTLLPNKCVELSESSVSRFMVENKSTIRAINLYNDLSEKNVKFVYTPEELQRLRRANQDPAQKIYILFFSVNIESQDEATWSETLDIFLAIEDSSSNILVAVNKDNNPEILEAEQIGQVNKLAIWSAGVYRTKDLHAMMKKMKTTNMAYPQSPAKEKTLGFCEIVYAKVRCPNDGCNLEEVQKLMWTCYECNEILEFDLKESFYCDCGSRLAKQFEFKCCRESHGTTRNTFCDEMIQDLQQLKKCEQINILIIGETGVGKTTFINSTACYTKYGSLTEAEQNDLMWLIPFKIEDGQRVVKVGDPGNNEQFDGVGSATQHPLEHYFKVDDYIYCLIDTPGIGDTRGIRQDKINMQNIMHSLKKFDKLHQICFLMDPDKCRLTETFEFCFKELIMQFHRSALRNLVFCFTRGSGVCYQPGATLTPLRALMDEIAEKFNLQYELKQGETVFVVDNFAYRYLALTLEGKLSIPDRPIYENSYEVSSKVIKQMMARATSKSIPPHLVKDSQHVNQARSVIVAITDPLTLIGTAVRNTLSQQEQFQRDLISCTLTRAELEEKVEIRLKTFHYTMEMENKWSCKLCNKKVYYRGEQRHKFIEADPSLANEDPIVVWEGPNAEENDGVPFCPQHGVKFPKVLSNRTFYTKVAEEVRRDPLIEQQLANATSSAEKQRILIQESKNLTNALQAEEKLINKAAAKFGLFLKNSTLVHYNDKTESHLLLCIHLEEERGGVRSQKWKDLQHMLKQYKEERDIITLRMMEAGDLPLQSIDPQDVLALIEELKDLKYYGKDVVKALKLLENNAYPQNVQPTYYKDKSTPSKFRRALKWMGKLFKF